MQNVVNKLLLLARVQTEKKLEIALKMWSWSFPR